MVKVIVYTAWDITDLKIMGPVNPSVAQRGG